MLGLQFWQYIVCKNVWFCSSSRHARVGALRLRSARSRAVAAMLNPYGEASGGDGVDDSGIGSRGCGEAAALERPGSLEIGQGHAASLASCATPRSLRKTVPRGGEEGRLARDPGQPI